MALLTAEVSSDSALGLLFDVVGQVHDPRVAFDPATAHDLARLATTYDVLRGVQAELRATPTSSSKRVVEDRCPPSSVPSEVRAFWVAYLDETRQYDPANQALNWKLGLKSWKALYGAFLCPIGYKYAVLLSVLAKRLVHTALHLDTDVAQREAANNFFQPIRDALTQALKDGSTKVSSRRDALFGLAISLFRLYFHLNTHQLSAQIVRQIQPHMPKLGATYEYNGQQRRYYSLADEVELRYLLGVFHLGQRRISEAHVEFRQSFDLCSHTASWQNRRLILIKLVATSLLLGVFPAEALLREFSVLGMFRPLIHGIRTGDLGTYLHTLGATGGEWARDRAELYRGYKILGVLQEKGTILVWRSLLRKTVLLYRQMVGSDRPTMPISYFLTALRFATGDDSYDLQDAECICVTLIDQGFLRAYIVHSSQTLVFSKKGTDMGFHPIAEVRMR